MNRRTALKAMATGLATFILPAPGRQIDLKTFCSPYEKPKYDMRLPYVMEDWTYATDGRACVRVRPEFLDTPQHKGEIPPFGTLSWNHGRLKGWRELPRLEPLPARDSCCPVCDGMGYRPGVIPTECPTCDGMGQEWVGAAYNISHPITCRDCNGRGHVAPDCPECAHCKGKALGTFPSVVILAGRYFDAPLYEKVRALGGEYLHDNLNCNPAFPLLKFRFEGGDGMLMGMDKAGVERRLVKP